ncbi:MAG: thioredoxin family protein [Fibrobacterales bacterium]
MKQVKVLGGGCRNCEVLAEETVKAASEMGIEINLTKVADFGEIAGYGVMTTPALVVDEVLQFQGQVKKAEEIKSFLV